MYVVYATKNNFTREEKPFKKYKKSTQIASLEYVLDFKNNMMIITSLFSNKKGFATRLLIYACCHARKYGITKIEVDDCTDRYRQDHNFYTKNGFKYVENTGPEMVGNVESVLNWWDHFPL